MPSSVLSERAHARRCVLLLLSHNVPLERTCPRPVVPGLQPPLRQRGAAEGGTEGRRDTGPPALSLWVLMSGPGDKGRGEGCPVKGEDQRSGALGSNDSVPTTGSRGTLGGGQTEGR